MDLLKITSASFAAIFINNFVFSRFLGFCPFFTVSKKPYFAVIPGLAVTVLMTLTCAVLYPLNHYVLAPMILEKYLQTAVFVFLAYLITQAAQFAMKRIMPYSSGEIFSYFPLLSSNCAVLGAAFIIINENYNIIQGLVFSFSSGIGLTLALLMMSSVKERIDSPHIPAAFKDLPISLISAALMALSMYGFTGIFK
jgi:electron transport complex protein RnfA